MKPADFFENRILSDNEGKESLAKILRIILLVTLITIPAAIIIRYFDDRTLSSVDLTLILLFLTYAISFFLLKRGGFLSGSLLFIISGWVAMSILAGRAEGIKDVVVTGYILLIYLATLFTGYRFAIVITIFSVISIWTMAALEHSGILIPHRDHPLNYARDFTFFIILVIAIVILIERSFTYSYLRLTRELQERTSAEEKLKVNEKELKAQNEDLIMAKSKAEESDRLKTAFLHNISHEIRTPMNGIVGLSELMRSPGITREERADYIDKMLNCSEQLAALIDDLIYVSKLEIGAIEIVKSEFSPADLLNDSLRLFSRRATEKGLNIEATGNLKEIRIISDRLKLSQIINSLADNAIKFTCKGTISINVNITGNNLVLKVADTGIGIPEEEIPYIFDHFRQSEVGLVRVSRGAGLGLSICRGNLNYLGGTISVESRPGKGSIFTVSVPVEITGEINKT